METWRVLWLMWWAWRVGCGPSGWSAVHPEGQRAQLHAASRTSERGRDGEGYPIEQHGGGGPNGAVACRWCLTVLVGNDAFQDCQMLTTFSGPLVTRIGPCRRPSDPANIVASERGRRVAQMEILRVLWMMCLREVWLWTDLCTPVYPQRKVRGSSCTRMSECGHDGEDNPIEQHGVVVQMVLWPAVGV